MLNFAQVVIILSSALFGLLFKIARFFALLINLIDILLLRKCRIVTSASLVSSLVWYILVFLLTAG